MRKPPLGLMPKNIWEIRRIWKISEAIDRYLEAGMKIPAEWVDEYCELVRKQ